MITALFRAIKRGLDFQRDPGTFSVHPYPQRIGYLSTLAPLTSSVLHQTAVNPTPTQLVGIGQYGILPKQN